MKTIFFNVLYLMSGYYPYFLRSQICCPWKEYCCIWGCPYIHPEDPNWENGYKIRCRDYNNCARPLTCGYGHPEDQKRIILVLCHCNNPRCSFTHPHEANYENAGNLLNESDLWRWKHCEFYEPLYNEKSFCQYKSPESETQLIIEVQQYAEATNSDIRDLPIFDPRN